MQVILINLSNRASTVMAAGEAYTFAVATESVRMAVPKSFKHREVHLVLTREELQNALNTMDALSKPTPNDSGSLV